MGVTAGITESSHSQQPVPRTPFWGDFILSGARRQKYTRVVIHRTNGIHQLAHFGLLFWQRCDIAFCVMPKWPMCLPSLSLSKRFL